MRLRLKKAHTFRGAAMGWCGEREPQAWVLAFNGSPNLLPKLSNHRTIPYNLTLRPAPPHLPIMSVNGRPVMKLKLNTGGPMTTSQPPTPSEQTPGGTLKIKFKSTPSASATPVAESAPALTDTPKKKRQYTKKPKASKDEAAAKDSAAPTPKTKGKKRPAEDDAGGRPAKQPSTGGGLKIRLSSQTSITPLAEASPQASIAVTPASAKPPPLQRRTTIKLNTATKAAQSLPTPGIRIKAKGLPPKRPVGVGYDSEAEEIEDDPATEQQFVLRMAPGEDCDQLRTAVQEKKIGLKASEGGVDVHMKALDKEGRRTLVTIKGRPYAASLVDLPCIIEGMKSWDRKNWLKSGDIHQMLMVLGPCKDEKEALNYPLPPEVERETYQYPHGLTPPLRYVRKRRFRKRTDYRSMEAVEAAVEKLIEADERAASTGGDTKWELVDLNQRRREEEAAEEEEDAPYEEDYFGQNAMEPEIDDDFLQDFEAQLEQADEDMEPATTAATPLTETPVDSQNPHSAVFRKVQPHGALGTDSRASTPAAAETPAAGTTSADDDDDADEDDADDVMDDMDDDAMVARQQRQQEAEEIAELEREIEDVKKRLAETNNPLLKARLHKKVEDMMNDLKLKRGGDGGGDWEE